MDDAIGQDIQPHQLAKAKRGDIRVRHIVDADADLPVARDVLCQLLQQLAIPFAQRISKRVARFVDLLGFDAFKKGVQQHDLEQPQQQHHHHTEQQQIGKNAAAQADPAGPRPALRAFVLLFRFSCLFRALCLFRRLRRCGQCAAGLRCLRHIRARGRTLLLCHLTRLPACCAQRSACYGSKR